MLRTALRAASISTILVTLVLAFVATPVGATHNNQGTVKVHDDADENPDIRNVPHVSCDFWIEGFKLGDDSGWIRFFGWPPTGDKTEVTPTGDDLDWAADSGSASGEYHFLSGPYQLPTGHYRVEVYTNDGHPGSDSGHFAKAKTFWVEPCEGPVVNPPCPTILGVEATSQDGNAAITLTWSAAAGAETYMVYRALPGEDFELAGSVDGDTLTYRDEDVEAGVTYEYYVTAVIGGIESENCEVVEASAIPFFPTLLVGVVAVAGSVGAYVLLRRRS